MGADTGSNGSRRLNIRETSLERMGDVNGNLWEPAVETSWMKLLQKRQFSAKWCGWHLLCM
jgi:hypothetical protein